MRKVIGIGETILDIIFRGNQPYVAVPGGSVFNGLVSLGRLGVDVLFISEIGNDKVGDIIQQFMQENHISTQYVDRFPDGKSPLSLAFLDEHQNAQYSFYKDYPKQRLEVPLPPIEEDDIFIFGSYYSLNPALRKRVYEFLDAYLVGYLVLLQLILDVSFNCFFVSPYCIYEIPSGPEMSVSILVLEICMSGLG